MEPSTLKIPLTDARGALAERIAKGDSFRVPQELDPDAFAFVKQEVEAWRDYNRTWLNKFVGGELAEEYWSTSTVFIMPGRMSARQEQAFLQEQVRAEVGKLQSISDRLELLEPPSGEATYKGAIRVDAFDIERRRDDRTRVMNAIFNAAGGSQGTFVPMEPIGTELNLDDDRLADATDYLEGQGLIKPMRAVWGRRTPIQVMLTHAAILEVEESRTKPSEATEHLAPYTSITNIYNAPVGAVGNQVNSPGATQTVTAGDLNFGDVRDAVDIIRATVGQVGLGTAVDTDVLADLDTIDAQLRRSEPRQGVIRESLQAIQQVMIGAGGSLAAAGILDALGRVHF
jgi:hypothetical protein